MNRGVYFVLATAVISGFAIFVNKIGVTGIDASVYTLAKNLVAGLLLFSLIIGVKKFKELRALKKGQWIRLATIGLVGGSIPFVLFFTGLQLTTAARGAFIHKSMFIFIAVFAVFFLKEKLSKKILIPAVLLLVGNALFLNLPSGLETGDLLILAATLFWAVEIIISKHTLRAISPSVVGFGRMFFGAIFMLVYLVATGGINQAGSLLANWPWVLITGGILFLYVSTFYTGLKTVKAHVAASVLLLGSPITTLLSVAFLDGSLSMGHLVGTVFIVSGVAVMVYVSERLPDRFVAKAHNGGI